MDGIPSNILDLFSDALIVQLFNGLRTSVAVREEASRNILIILVTFEVSQLVAPFMLVREEAL